MRPRTRRRLDAVLLVAGSLVVGGVGAIGAVAARPERVARLWSLTEVADDGAAAITEVVDYDFGFTARHGIFRDVPGLPLDAAVEVSSPTAPDDVVVEPGEHGTRIRVGDPDRTITGAHRYRLGYRLDDVAVGGRLRHDVVGVFWEVPISEVEAHITAPWRFVDPRCDQGTAGSTGGCVAEQTEPGHLVVRAHDLDTGEGITVEAGRGTSLESGPVAPAPPARAPTDDGAGILLPALASLGAGLLAAGATSRLVRRAGRESLWPGGATDAAFGPGAGDGGVLRVDSDELAELATVEFAPPGDLTPSHGSVVLRESVDNDAKVSWLIEAAIDGAVDITEDGTRPTLRRGERTADGDTGPLLTTAFAGRDEVPLGKYDPSFASAWNQLGDQLVEWKAASGYWDARADRRRIAAIVGGILAAVAGLAGVAGFAYLAADRGAAWLAGCAMFGGLAGAGLAAAVRAWELRVRTPQGSAAFLRVESFRRFLAESEAYHAEQAAERGVLREYTAWAVAVGEIDRWSRAVSAATIAPSQASYVHYALLAPSLASATSSASTAPSSSGGGGGGGGVGGGSGGGGGGSW